MLEGTGSVATTPGSPPEELTHTLQAARNLVDYLQTHPEAVVLGKEQAKEKKWTTLRPAVASARRPHIPSKRTPAARFFALRPVAEAPRSQMLDTRGRRRREHRWRASRLPARPSSAAACGWSGPAGPGSTSCCVGRSRWTRPSVLAEDLETLLPSQGAGPGAWPGRACVWSRPLRSPAGAGTGVALRPLRSPARAQRAGARHPRRDLRRSTRARSERPGTGHRGRPRRGTPWPDGSRTPSPACRRLHRSRPVRGHGSRTDVTGCPRGAMLWTCIGLDGLLSISGRTGRERWVLCDEPRLVGVLTHRKGDALLSHGRSTDLRRRPPAATCTDASGIRVDRP